MGTRHKGRIFFFVFSFGLFAFGISSRGSTGVEVIGITSQSCCFLLLSIFLFCFYFLFFFSFAKRGECSYDF